MKKIYPALLMAGLALGASAQNKFDASSSMILQIYKDMQTYPAATHIKPVHAPFDMQAVASRADATVSVFVRMAAGVSAYSLENDGFEVTTDLGEIAIVSGTMDAILALENNPDVVSVSFGGVAKPMLDKSREVTGMDIVQEGSDGLPAAYTGKGVIAAIFDIGMDPNHANFLDEDKNPRIKVLYNYPSTDGKCTTFSTPDRIKSFTTDNASETHGTHTTGCMAGSFNGRGGKVAVFRPNGNVLASATNKNPYYGMAPESEIAMGCGPLYLDNVVAGVKKMIEYAENQGKPVAVNLSIGSNSGPHDGTDNQTSALNALGDRAIICVAAGNEGDTQVSIVRNFTATDNSFKSIFWDGNYNYSGIADVWSDNSTPFDFELQVLDTTTGTVKYSTSIKGGEETTFTLATSNFTSPTYQHAAAFDEAFSSSNLIVKSSKNTNTNNRYSVTLSGQISYNNSTNRDKKLVLAIAVKGSAGQRVVACSDMADFYSLNVPGYVDGNAAMSINNLACGKKTISVGAWNARNQIASLFGQALTYGDMTGLELNEVAGYSSYGTLCDGRVLPDVCAPGTAIVSSISTPYAEGILKQDANYVNYFSANQPYNNRDNYWEAEQGTSMATPIVTGSIVTWLEAKKDITVEQARDAIKKGAVIDSYVTSYKPQAQWGASGKFNALNSLKILLGIEGIDDVKADANSKLILTKDGSDWEIFLPYATSINAALYNIAGAKVASATANGDTAVLGTSGIEAGIYILNVNGTESRRIVVK